MCWRSRTCSTPSASSRASTSRDFQCSSRASAADAASSPAASRTHTLRLQRGSRCMRGGARPSCSRFHLQRAGSRGKPRVQAHETVTTGPNTDQAAAVGAGRGRGQRRVGQAGAAQATTDHCGRPWTRSRRARHPRAVRDLECHATARASPRSTRGPSGVHTRRAGDAGGDGRRHHPAGRRTRGPAWKRAASGSVERLGTTRRA